MQHVRYGAYHSTSVRRLQYDVSAICGRLGLGDLAADRTACGGRVMSPGKQRCWRRKMTVNRVLSPDPLHLFDRQGHRAEVFVHLAGEDVRPVAVEHGAEPAVGLREKGGFHQTGLVLEGQKLHGIAVLGADHLAGDRAGRPPAPAGRQVSLNRRL